MPNMPKHSSNGGIWPSMQDNALQATLFVVILILLATLFASLTLKTLVEANRVGAPEAAERSITVDGSSSALSAPDIATVGVSVESKAEAVATAQSDNNRVITTITDQLKAAGIPADDIQTSYYNVYEDQVYNPDTYDYESRGWIVNQSLEVTVREISLVPSVLDIAGRNGATNINGPNYRIDDSASSKQQARVSAIANARKNAEEIASALGARLGDVIDYSEYSSSAYPRPYAETAAYGLGGAGDIAVEPGQEQTELNVSITYELVQ